VAYFSNRPQRAPIFPFHHYIHGERGGRKERGNYFSRMTLMIIIAASQPDRKFWKKRGKEKSGHLLPSIYHMPWRLWKEEGGKLPGSKIERVAKHLSVLPPPLQDQGKEDYARPGEGPTTALSHASRISNCGRGGTTTYGPFPQAHRQDHQASHHEKERGVLLPPRTAICCFTAPQRPELASCGRGKKKRKSGGAATLSLVVGIGGGRHL